MGRAWNKIKRFFGRVGKGIGIKEMISKGE